MATNTPRDTEKSTKRRNATLATGVAAAVIGAATLLSLPAGASQAEGHVFGTKAKGAIDGSYIVMLKGGQSNSVKAQGSDLAKKYGGKMKRTYDSAINGFAANGHDAEEAAQARRRLRRREGRAEPELQDQCDPGRPAVVGSGPYRPGEAPTWTRSTPTPTARARASRRTSSTPVSASRTRTSATVPRTASTPSTTTTTPTTATATAPTSRAPSPVPTTVSPRRPRSSPSVCWTTRAPAPPSRSSRASTG